MKNKPSDRLYSIVSRRSGHRLTWINTFSVITSNSEDYLDGRSIQRHRCYYRWKEEGCTPLVIKCACLQFPFICWVHYCNGASINSWGNLSSRELMNLRLATHPFLLGTAYAFLCLAATNLQDQVLGMTAGIPNYLSRHDVPSQSCDRHRNCSQHIGCWVSEKWHTIYLNNEVGVTTGWSQRKLYCLHLFAWCYLTRVKRVRKTGWKEKLNVHVTEKKKFNKIFHLCFQKTGNLENSEINNCCTWKEKSELMQPWDLIMPNSAEWVKGATPAHFILLFEEILAFEAQSWMIWSLGAKGQT